MKRLRLAISGLTACSGCQLSLLNCETELPQMLKTAEFHYFPMACTPAVLEGYYDAALVEGCLSMPHEHELLLALRERSRYLVAVGTCATWGGVAALRNGEDRELMRQQVYGENRMACDTHDPRPLHTAVKVDADVSGCPPEKEELLRLIAGLMRGALPAPISHTVCSDCRMRENLCLLTECSQLCLGPLTMGGCGARCPSLGVSCEGCRGPAPEANLAAATEIYLRKGYDRATVCERLKRFCPEWKP
jgi:coenzyme F420-reducing hydrogenase gamma subunit